MTRASAFTRAPEPVESDFSTEFPKTANGAPDFAAIREHPDFVRVRRRVTRFVLPASIVFFTWYMTYVLLAAYAPGLMARPVSGSVTVGLLLGLSQFVTTVVIMLWYARFTRKKVDPAVERLRARAGERRS